MDIAFIGEATCAMHEVIPNKETKHCHISETDACHKKVTSDADSNYEKEDCCKTETITVINSGDFQTEKDQSVTYAVVLSIFYPFILEEIKIDQNTEFEYHDPDLELDVQIAFQTFLI